jgi:hypothetical protein
MFIVNKYYRWYFSIISSAEGRKKPGNYEVHHILPKALFPQFKNLRNNEWNGILLTPKEHFICHLLLPRFTEGKARWSMTKAITRMASSSHKSISSRVFEVYRIRHKEWMKGRKFTEEQKMKMRKPKPRVSLALKGRKQNPESARKSAISRTGLHHSEESKKKMSLSKKGKPNHFKGKKRSQSTIEKMKLAQIKRHSEKNYKGKMKKEGHWKQSFYIDEIHFKCISEAARIYNCARDTVCRRLKSKDFPTWKFSDL